MSYARWTEDSNVYAFMIEGGWECHCCGINRGETLQFKTLLGLRLHLVDHRERGQKVPQYAFDRIDYELQNPDDPDNG